LYLPLVFMLLGLIFRGVAFEFRFKANEAHRHIWDKAFIGGSMAATFFQGVTLGAYIQGIHVEGKAYAGGAMDWLTPFSVFTGVGLLVAYGLLGCTWLIMKTEGPLQERMRRIARPLTWVLLAVIGIISLWTPLSNADIARRWFTLPNLLWFSPVPILVLLAIWQLRKALLRSTHSGPFVLTLCVIFLGYSGLGISLWPNIIPPGVSIWAAAAPPQSQGFALVGALLIIPLILMYTAWGYYVFRGKVNASHGYH
jgi:cytochrome d ubiquinol oxidase subunit II